MATIAPTQHPATLVKQGSQRPSQIHVGHVLPLPSSIHLTKVNKTRCEETGTTAIKHPAFDHFHRKANIQMRASPILWFFALPIVVLFHYFFLPFWWARQVSTCKAKRSEANPNRSEARGAAFIGRLYKLQL